MTMNDGLQSTPAALPTRDRDRSKSAVSRRDAWIVARLLCGKTSEGVEPTAILRPLIDALEAADLADRQSLFHQAMIFQADPEGFIALVADQDPLGPPPQELTGRRARVVKLEEVEILPVEWLWHPRIPLGMITLFAGDPKLGKSFATAAIAAAVSRGAPLPMDQPRWGPAGVVMLNAEDDVARTIKPRLQAAGANMAKVRSINAIVNLENGAESFPSLATDIPQIEEAIADLKDCRLLVIDPVTAYLGGVDDHKNGDIRGILGPLKEMAERTQVAVVLVTHLNKSSSGGAQGRVIGSKAYVGTARSNLLFAKDPDHKDNKRVLICGLGANLTAAFPTIGYVIADRGDGPVVEWCDAPIEIDADEALRDPGDPEDRKVENEAADWLRAVLSDGPMLAKDVFALGVEQGLSKDQVKRAKVKIGITTEKAGFGFGSGWNWTLPKPAPKVGSNKAF